MGGCGHQGCAERLHFLYMIQDGQEHTAARGTDLPKLSQIHCLQTIYFLSVQQDDLPLASSLAPVSSHARRQETAVARASSFLWKKQRAVARLPLLISPAWPLPGARGYTFHWPGPLDHTSLACHLLAMCHLCTC